MTDFGNYPAVTDRAIARHLEDHLWYTKEQARVFVTIWKLWKKRPYNKPLQASFEDIAHKSKHASGTVSRAVKQLIEDGLLIRVQERKGAYHPAQYEVRLPRELTGSPEDPAPKREIIYFEVIPGGYVQ